MEPVSLGGERQKGKQKKAKEGELQVADSSRYMGHARKVSYVACYFAEGNGVLWEDIFPHNSAP